MWDNHIGPYRHHVNLARVLSTRGLTSIRFDFSNTGESLPQISDIEHCQECCDAIDLLQTEYDLKQFVLIGFGATADIALSTAERDQRVTGLLLVDGYGYRTAKFYVRYVQSHVARCRRYITKREQRNNANSPSNPGLRRLRDFPSRETVVQKLQELSDRDVLMHFIYTASANEYYNHATQFTSMFRDVSSNGRLTTCHLPDFEHVPLLCEDRRRLSDEITNWTTANFAANCEIN